MQPTDKQLKSIRLIEKHLSISFTGSTISEASEFIGKHMKKSMKQAEVNRQRNYDRAKQFNQMMETKRKERERPRRRPTPLFLEEEYHVNNHYF